MPLPWTREGSSFGFGSGGAHLPQPSWFVDASVQAEEGDPASTLSLYRRALALRHELLALERLEWVETGRGDVLRFRRPNGWEVVMVFGSAPLAPQVWEKFESLPIVTIPKQRSKPIKRFTALVAALTKDKVVDQAVKRANDEICRVVESRATQCKEKVDAARQDVLTLSGEELRTRLGGGQFVSSSFDLTADTRAIIEAYKLASRHLSPALCSAYVDYIVPDDAIEDDLLEAYIEVAAIGLVPEVVQSVEAEADRLAQKWLTDTRVDRKNLSDDQQAEYDRLEGMSTEPERVSLISPKTGQAETKLREADGTETLLPVDTAHLMVAEDGTFPLDLNKWESDVLNAESKRNGFVAWWRNPDRAVKESLAIAYTDSSKKWRALRPDFVFFAQGQNGIVVDLVDPHGHASRSAMRMRMRRGPIRSAGRVPSAMRRRIVSTLTPSSSAAPATLVACGRLAGAVGSVMGFLSCRRGERRAPSEGASGCSIRDWGSSRLFPACGRCSVKHCLAQLCMVRQLSISTYPRSTGKTVETPHPLLCGFFAY